MQANDLFGDSFSATPSSASNGFGASSFEATPTSTAHAASTDPFGGSSFHLAPPPPPPPVYQPPAAPPGNFGNNSFQSHGAPGVPNGLNANIFGHPATPFDTNSNNNGFSHTSGQGFSNNQSVSRNQSFSGITQSTSVNQSYYGASQNMNGLNRSASAPQELQQLQQPPKPQQPARKEFGPVKSAIWGDTLSMGLVDLNIAGREHSFSLSLSIYLLIFCGSFTKCILVI